MNNQNLPVVCRACGRTVRMDSIKYDENHKAYVCSNCYSGSRMAGTKPQQRSAPSVASPRQPGKLSIDKVNYQCVKCGYAFSKAKGKAPSGCPYCGNKVLQEKDTAAEKLLKEAEGWD